MKSYIFWDITPRKSTDISKKNFAFSFSVEEYAKQKSAWSILLTRVHTVATFSTFLCSPAVSLEQNPTKKGKTRSIWLRSQDLHVIISLEYSSPSHIESDCRHIKLSFCLVVTYITVTYLLTYLLTHGNPCGGGVEYLHREPASCKRRRNGAKKAAP
jgi:hypothetical protein